MKQTAVQWLIESITLGLSEKGMKTAFDKALEMEKEQIKQIREMLMQGALTNMSCSSAIVELDKITYEAQETN